MLESTGERVLHDLGHRVRVADMGTGDGAHRPDMGSVEIVERGRVAGEDGADEQTVRAR